METAGETGAAQTWEANAQRRHTSARASGVLVIAVVPKSASGLGNHPGEFRVHRDVRVQPRHLMRGLEGWRADGVLGGGG